METLKDRIDTLIFHFEGTTATKSDLQCFVADILEAVADAVQATAGFTSRELADKIRKNDFKV